MTNDPMRIHLSLVSHTNIGKTTLARTLLSRDIGEVADRAHVTETTDDYVLARTPEGCELILWDTPGFGNSVALAKRLDGRANPVGWFLSEVWDRLANKSLWLNQKAIKHVKETSNVVLYLVNATELPDTAPYVNAEMRILSWIGKPVIVLLNQMGEPKTPEAEQADVDRWKNAMSNHSIVSSVLPMDAFARCWVQEYALFDAIAQALPEELQATMNSLQEVWSRKRQAQFSASIDALALYMDRLSKDREICKISTFLYQIKLLKQKLHILDETNDPINSAQTALSSRAADEFCALTDKLISIYHIKGKGIRRELLKQIQSNWNILSPLPPALTATAGALSSGAAGGLASDLLSGGALFGLGTLIGTIFGALGGAGFAIAYNHRKAIDGRVITWSNSSLEYFLIEAVKLYLAISHYGRGRGAWDNFNDIKRWDESISKDISKESIASGEYRREFERIIKKILCINNF